MTYTLSEILGYIIKTHRTQFNKSQRDLAVVADLHEITISKIERGVSQTLKITTLHKIAKALQSFGSCRYTFQILELAELLYERQQKFEIPKHVTTVQQLINWLAIQNTQD